MAADDDVDVLGQNAARPHRHAGLSDQLSKPFANGFGLNARECHGWISQSGLRFTPQLSIVRSRCNGLAGFDLSCGAKSEQLPCADEIGPRAARGVGTPEAVGADYNMRRVDHGFSECVGW